MAGFFKKIFSFGKKEVVEERVDETAPLPPIKWDALEALKPETEQEPAKPEPSPDIPPAPEPVIPPAPEPVVPSEPEPLPQPQPEEEPRP
ncbi:signal recognition particle-docking protein FtsY, partial [Mesorhizobium sp. M1A.F.Ca.IN.020.03.2.1]